MGLADTLAALIRPRRRGMFVPQPTREALSSAMIAEGATASIAREATRNFVRALSRDAASQLEATFAKLGPVTQPVDGEVADVVTRTTEPTIIEKLVAELKWNTQRVQLPGKIQAVKVNVRLDTGDDPDTYDTEATKQIDEASQQAGRVAGLRAAAKGASRQDAYAESLAAEVSTRTRLRARVDAGESFPHLLHADLLASAGFNDVASRDTPPPIVLSTPCFPAMPDVRVEFAAPVESNAAEIRRVCEKVLRDRLGAELAQGIRDAKQGIVY